MTRVRYEVSTHSSQFIIIVVVAIVVVIFAVIIFAVIIFAVVITVIISAGQFNGGLLRDL